MAMSLFLLLELFLRARRNKGHNHGLSSLPFSSPWPKAKREGKRKEKAVVTSLSVSLLCLSSLFFFEEGKKRQEGETGRQDVTNHTFGLTARSQNPFFMSSGGPRVSNDWLPVSLCLSLSLAKRPKERRDRGTEKSGFATMAQLCCSREGKTDRRDIG